MLTYHNILYVCSFILPPPPNRPRNPIVRTVKLRSFAECLHNRAAGKPLLPCLLPRWRPWLVMAFLFCLFCVNINYQYMKGLLDNIYWYEMVLQLLEQIFFMKILSKALWYVILVAGEPFCGVLCHIYILVSQQQFCSLLHSPSLISPVANSNYGVCYGRFWSYHLCSCKWEGGVFCRADM